MTDADRLVVEAQRIDHIRRRLERQKAERLSDDGLLMKASWDDVEFLLSALQQAQAQADVALNARVEESRRLQRDRDAFWVSLKRMSTPEAREFWQSVKQAAKDWEANEPEWSRKLRAADVLERQQLDHQETRGSVAARPELETLIAKWRREAAEEQRVSFCADELESALAAPPRERGEWAPIETAPKDGSYVVLFGRCAGDASHWQRACVSRWCEKAEDSPFYIEGWPFAAPGYSDRFLPTHWMPLPVPPVPSPDGRTE